MINLKSLLICSLTFLSVVCDEPNQNAIRIDIPKDSLSGTQYALTLVKPDESVLHPNIKVISLVGNNNDDRVLSADTWTPSNSDLEAAQGNLYIDEENLAALRLNFDEEKGEHVAVNGVVNGNRIEEGRSAERKQEISNRTDYVDIGRNITPSNGRQRSSSSNIVEVLLVCDKEFSDLFNQDRRRILDYFTVYFWDINLRYKTLPNTNIAFRITGIVIINSPSGQPFIEEARASDGRAEFGRILGKFAGWVYGQMSSVPKFDVAIAITNARLEWGGGLAYFRTACHTDPNSRIHYSTAIWNDAGDWGSVTIGAHEIAHVLGAPHDDDSNFPGGCPAKGYIMSGANDDLKWFFSSCSDRTIGEFVGSNEASCLRRLDETSQEPAISPDFSSVFAPSMNEQCQSRLKDSRAFVREDDSTCNVMKCWLPFENGWYIWSYTPVENSQCQGGGRCFRGRCRKLGSILFNVATGQCARARNPFAFMAPLEMTQCVDEYRKATPLEKFVVEDSPSNGKFLQTPYSSLDAKENGEKCVYTGYGEGDAFWTDKCDLDNPWQGWNIIDLGQGTDQVMLQHRVTGRCAKQSGGYIYSYPCDSNDLYMRWVLVHDN